MTIGRTLAKKLVIKSESPTTIYFIVYDFFESKKEEGMKMSPKVTNFFI